MKTVYYLLIVGIGVLLSVPLTIVVIAWQQANQSAHEIWEYLESLKK